MSGEKGENTDRREERIDRKEDDMDGREECVHGYIRKRERAMKQKGNTVEDKVKENMKKKKLWKE